MALERYSVIVDKQYLQFCSAHFIHFKGQREALHGHNFHCSVMLEGDLTADHYVIDFADAKAAARRACEAIDHRVLLPGAGNEVQVELSGNLVSVSCYGEPLFVLPAVDVCILPLANVTAELLAHYLTGEIINFLPEEGRRSLHEITVEVEETPGQRAAYRRVLRQP